MRQGGRSCWKSCIYISGAHVPRARLDDGVPLASLSVLSQSATPCGILCAEDGFVRTR